MNSLPNNRELLTIHVHQLLGQPGNTVELTLKAVAIGDANAEISIIDHTDMHEIYNLPNPHIIGVVNEFDICEGIISLLIDKESEVLAPVFDGLDECINYGGLLDVSYEAVGQNELCQQLILLCWSRFGDGQFLGNTILKIPHDEIESAFNKAGTLLHADFLKKIERAVDEAQIDAGTKKILELCGLPEEDRPERLWVMFEGLPRLDIGMNLLILMKSWAKFKDFGYRGANFLRWAMKGREGEVLRYLDSDGGSGRHILSAIKEFASRDYMIPTSHATWLVSQMSNPTLSWLKNSMKEFSGDDEG